MEAKKGIYLTRAHNLQRHHSANCGCLFQAFIFTCVVRTYSCKMPARNMRGHHPSNCGCLFQVFINYHAFILAQNAGTQFQRHHPANWWCLFNRALVHALPQNAGAQLARTPSRKLRMLVSSSVYIVRDTNHMVYIVFVPANSESETSGFRAKYGAQFTVTPIGVGKLCQCSSVNSPATQIVLQTTYASLAYVVA